MTPVIRRAEPGEGKALTALAMHSKAYWGYSPEFMKKCSSELEVSEAKLRSTNYRYYVAELDGKVAGFAAIEHTNQNKYELEALFVDPLYMRRGLGRALIDSARFYLRESGGDTLIIQGDPNAGAFYESVGATLVGQKESGSIPGRQLPLFHLRIYRGEAKQT